MKPAALLAAAVVVSSGCDETSPTAADPSLLPVAPTTVEVRIPFSDFGHDVGKTPGYGRVSALNTALVANRFQGALDARALVRFADYPASVSVANDAGVVVTDTSLAFLRGRVVALIDTTNAVYDGPVTLVAEALNGGRWDSRSVSWDRAVDTVPDMRDWPEPGAGPAVAVDTAVWDPSSGDSIVFEVDSITVNAWADTTDAGRGLRVSAADAGTRLELSSVLLRLDVLPSVRPDTLLERPVDITSKGFVYDAGPPPPSAGEFRVGSAPSWRTTFGVQLADTLNGPPELCEAFGCPFLLTAESVNYAALTLTTAPSPPGFQPDDTLSLDVRAVLSEQELPKSPLSASLLGPSSAGFGVRIPPEYFEEGSSGTVSMGITSFIQDLLRGETPLGDPAPTTLALLTLFEPLSLEILTFEGAGTDEEPYLRMILTTRVGVPLR